MVTIPHGGFNIYWCGGFSGSIYWIHCWCGSHSDFICQIQENVSAWLLDRCAGMGTGLLVGCQFSSVAILLLCHCVELYKLVWNVSQMFAKSLGNVLKWVLTIISRTTWEHLHSILQIVYLVPLIIHYCTLKHREEPIIYYYTYYALPCPAIKPIIMHATFGEPMIIIISYGHPQALAMANCYIS